MVERLEGWTERRGAGEMLGLRDRNEAGGMEELEEERGGMQEKEEGMEGRGE